MTDGWEGRSGSLTTVAPAPTFVTLREASRAATQPDFIPSRDLGPVQNTDTLRTDRVYCALANAWFFALLRLRWTWLIGASHRVLAGMAYGVDLGGGALQSKAWHSLDRKTGLDLVTTDFSFLADRSLRRIMSHHFIEHIREDDFLRILLCLRAKMAPDCVFRIACPDGFDRQNRRTLMDHGHMEAWDYRRVSSIAARAGLKIDLLQYFDEDGNLVVRKSLFDLGYIRSHTLVTEAGNFKILRGLGRYNLGRGEVSEEHSLFFDLTLKGGG